MEITRNSKKESGLVWFMYEACVCMCREFENQTKVSSASNFNFICMSPVLVRCAVYELERNDCKHSTSSFTSYSTMVCSHHTSIGCLVCGVVRSMSGGRAFGVARSKKPIQTLPFQHFSLTQAYVNKSARTHIHTTPPAPLNTEQSNKNQAYRFGDTSRKLNAR